MKRFSLIGIFAVLGYLILPATGSLAATTAAHASAAVSYHVTRGHAARIGASSRGVSGLHAVSQAPGRSREVPSSPSGPPAAPPPRLPPAARTPRRAARTPCPGLAPPYPPAGVLARRSLMPSTGSAIS